jgi:CRP/FNR family cyclic AMP-dependent transcriptional regulator
LGNTPISHSKTRRVESATMTATTAPATRQSTHALVAAIAHNTQSDAIGRFLDSVRWSVLGDYITPSTLERGHLLISQGDHDGRLYFLESGDLKVDMKSPNGQVHLAILGPGSVVGEGGFFTQQARNATVSVFTDCTVWTMTPNRFQDLVRDHPAAATSLCVGLGAVLATRTLDLGKRVAIT